MLVICLTSMYVSFPPYIHECSLPAFMYVSSLTFMYVSSLAVLTSMDASHPRMLGCMYAVEELPGTSWFGVKFSEKLKVDFWSRFLIKVVIKF